MSNSENRRYQERYSCSLNAKLKSNKGVLDCCVLDVSMFGAKIYCSAIDADIEITSLEFCAESFRDCLVEISWIHGPFVGVVFKEELSVNYAHLGRSPSAILRQAWFWLNRFLKHEGVKAVELFVVCLTLVLLVVNSFQIEEQNSFQSNELAMQTTMILENSERFINKTILENIERLGPLGWKLVGRGDKFEQGKITDEQLASDVILSHILLQEFEKMFRLSKLREEAGKNGGFLSLTRNKSAVDDTIWREFQPKMQSVLGFKEMKTLVESQAILGYSCDFRLHIADHSKQYEIQTVEFLKAGCDDER